MHWHVGHGGCFGVGVAGPRERIQRGGIPGLTDFFHVIDASSLWHKVYESRGSATRVMGRGSSMYVPEQSEAGECERRETGRPKQDEDVHIYTYIDKGKRVGHGAASMAGMCIAIMVLPRSMLLVYSMNMLYI